MMDETFYLTRDCLATLIPAGHEVVLEKDSPLTVNQALGCAITVSTPTGLFRIEREHLDALGEAGEAYFGSLLDSQEGEHALPKGPFSEEQVWLALKSCFDPEIPVNIVDLGLIYSLEIEPLDADTHHVDVQMTLTAQGCGMGPAIASDAKEKIEQLAGVSVANVQIVWDPPWNPSMISEAGKKKLGLD